MLLPPKKISPDPHMVNYTRLQIEFEKELNAHDIFDSSSVTAAFELIANELCTLPFTDSLIEIVPFQSIKFTLLFESGKMIMVSKSIEELEGQPSADIVVFSFFINRALIVSDVSEIKVLAKGLKEYLSR